MRCVEFDFSTIQTSEQFYRQFQQKFELFSGFGCNLDALWDMLTGGISLPVALCFIHMDDEKRTLFGKIIAVIHEAADILPGELEFYIAPPPKSSR